MSKEQRKYMRIGQAVCGIANTILILTFPIAMCNLAGFISNLV